LKRTPITAPTTPDHHIEESEFDILCNDNTIANSTTIASPISIEKDDDDEEEIEIEEPAKEESIGEESAMGDSAMGESAEEEESTVLGEEEVVANEPKPVYGSLASTKPISKSDQVKYTTIHMHVYTLYIKHVD
jgi:hypothetical protein